MKELVTEKAAERPPVEELQKDVEELEGKVSPLVKRAQGDPEG